MGELKVYQSLRRPASAVHQHFQTSSPLKPQGKLNSNFIWRLLRTCERKFVQMVLTKMAATPIYGKNLLNSSSPETEGGCPWDLVCSIGDVEPTKIVS